MDNTKIEEVRQYLTEKYGVPTETKIGNYTYKTINQDLEIFNKFIAALLECVKLAKLDNVDNQINAICEFAKNASPDDLNTITLRLERIAYELAKFINYSKNGFVKMMKEIGEVCNNKDFNTNCIINYFVKFLRINLVSYNKKSSRSFIGKHKGELIINK